MNPVADFFCTVLLVVMAVCFYVGMTDAQAKLAGDVAKPVAVEQVRKVGVVAKYKPSEHTSEELHKFETSVKRTE